MVSKVALLTAGGFAPCLSSAVGGLIERYTALAPEVEIIAYKYGYQGLLSGDYLTVTPEVRANAAILHRFGGSPIGNSRVKLTNAADLVKRGLVAEGVDPLQGRRRPADRRRRRRAAHHRRRRHQHHRRGSGGLPARQRLRADRGRPAQDHRQRRDPDPAVAGRLDRGRAGRPLRPERPRRAQLRLPDADRARGDGPALRLADRGHRAGVPGLAGHPGVGAGDRSGSGRLGRARRLRPRGPLRPGRRGRAAEAR